MAKFSEYSSQAQNLAIENLNRKLSGKSANFYKEKEAAQAYSQLLKEKDNPILIESKQMAQIERQTRPSAFTGSRTSILSNQDIARNNRPSLQGFQSSGRQSSFQAPVGEAIGSSITGGTIRQGFGGSTFVTQDSPNISSTKSRISRADSQPRTTVREFSSESLPSQSNQSQMSELGSLEVQDNRFISSGDRSTAGAFIFATEGELKSQRQQDERAGTQFSSFFITPPKNDLFASVESGILTARESRNIQGIGAIGVGGVFGITQQQTIRARQKDIQRQSDLIEINRNVLIETQKAFEENPLQFSEQKGFTQKSVEGGIEYGLGDEYFQDISSFKEANSYFDDLGYFKPKTLPRDIQLTGKEGFNSFLVGTGLGLTKLGIETFEFPAGVILTAGAGSQGKNAQELGRIIDFNLEGFGGAFGRGVKNIKDTPLGLPEYVGVGAILSPFIIGETISATRLIKSKGLIQGGGDIIESLSPIKIKPNIYAATGESSLIIGGKKSIAPELDLGINLGKTNVGGESYSVDFFNPNTGTGIRRSKLRTPAVRVSRQGFEYGTIEQDLNQVFFSKQTHGGRLVSKNRFNVFGENIDLTGDLIKELNAGRGISVTKIKSTKATFGDSEFLFPNSNKVLVQDFGSVGRDLGDGISQSFGGRVTGGGEGFFAGSRGRININPLRARKEETKFLFDLDKRGVGDKILRDNFDNLLGGTSFRGRGSGKTRSFDLGLKQVTTTPSKSFSPPSVNKILGDLSSPIKADTFLIGEIKTSSQFAGTGLYERTSEFVVPATRQNGRPSLSLIPDFKPLTTNQKTNLGISNPLLIGNVGRRGTRGTQRVIPNVNDILGVSDRQTPRQTTRLNTDLQFQQLIEIPKAPNPFLFDGFNFGRPTRFGFFPPIPGLGFDDYNPRAKPRGRKFKRTPSLISFELGITARKPRSGELTGLVERPILIRRLPRHNRIRRPKGRKR